VAAAAHERILREKTKNMPNEQSYGEDRKARLRVRAKPLEQADRLRRRHVDGARLAYGVLELDIGCLVGRNHTLLVQKDMTVSELRRAA
jgi:hypothetical protein